MDDKRLVFDEDAGNYDRVRPRYCGALFEDIASYARLGRGARALEIGPGTGQATAPFLHIGCTVDAVELGARMCGYLNGKFSGHRGFSVTNGSFEGFEGEEGAYDLVYAATAFHWIPEEIGYPKARRLLKDGGCLALFWNVPFVVREADPLHMRIQEAYRRYISTIPPPKQYDEEKYARVQSAFARYGFCDVQLKFYHGVRKLTADEYLSLLDSYSNHRNLPLEVKRPFYEEIRCAILEHGNEMTIYDTMDLHLGRK